MRSNIIFLIFLILITINSGCLNKGGRNAASEDQNLTDTSTVAYPGFTGIKQIYSKNILVREVTYKNGVIHGLMKTYLQNGQLYQSFWYENGIRQDTAKWYFNDGKVFRTTLFKNDSMNGIQTQYYRNRNVRAKLNFVNGVRTPYLEEFLQDGKKLLRILI